MKNIDKIKKLLKKNRDIKYVFVFGSSVKKPLPDSDIDILIGGDLNFSKKTDLSLEIELILKKKIDIVLTDQAPPELVLKALSSGVKLIVNEREELKKDYFRNLRLEEDRRNLQRLKIEKIKRRHNHG